MRNKRHGDNSHAQNLDQDVGFAASAVVPDGGIQRGQRRRRRVKMEAAQPREVLQIIACRKSTHHLKRDAVIVGGSLTEVTGRCCAKELLNLLRGLRGVPFG